MQGGVSDWGPCPQVFLALGELLLSCNWAVVADILLVGVGGLVLGPLERRELESVCSGLGGASETMG